MSETKERASSLCTAAGGRARCGAFAAVVSALAVGTSAVPIAAWPSASVVAGEAGKKREDGPKKAETDAKKKQEDAKKGGTDTAGKKEGEKAGEEETVKRVVGTAFIPPRMQVTRESSAEKLLTPEVRGMIGKALEFIRNAQHPNGSWGDTQFPESAGVTALCCLALMAEGSQPNCGRYGRELTAGLEFLLDHAKDDGQIAAKDTYRYGPMYDHAWATLCLLQAYGNMPWRTDMRDKAARAIQCLLRFQKVDGGWRYQMMKEGESDTLVTLNVLFALRLGIKCGFSIPQESLDRAVAFIKSNAIPDGRWYYKKGGPPGTVAISGCGVIAVYGSGDIRNPLVEAADGYILRYYQRLSPQDLADTPYA
ncbi:MAG: terpene cyclase/mutase family protein, partial [Planctomycetota bacterium]|nr:terpene cyclase/mutase family protein [Planctomycetota bacterium]